MSIVVGYSKTGLDCPVYFNPVVISCGIPVYRADV
ncbi:Uncharacterised protein [Yersinia enterocolitica]|uniref:Uncharacterized protein n=1 Tax=Yersinia enterocolitica TaxID=630 RepID=A0A0E1NBV8_YEREN|nr:hypothetical protein CH48_3357 [Yersinia enterocolitica]KGA68789.1 hypothetical protein DJ62_1462 [Yersinia enterocolitica]KGA70147.1 hypothetical protein DJ61_1459 [Yersinia enterocolitica]CFQ74078.1 Uncharacterised protein [Yersinia enterocolitica]CFW64274.1 Uncharacterised protein [Yersinia enterocolitica]